ncbi:hypothetical protein L5M43_00390 [Shewanella sp. SW36]|uniref:hypothetical protein n=1 Tax=unclassified Shewanella TaxID=196818 RepID=UPI0021D9C7E9|nr:MULTISPECIES: hypothetical protein [unclassified Shewanella]MCU7973726.1 hypothetical protein [Shewanella sp. SW36]MCU7989335.1 hypothetical protein [Shewanella sp. SW1]MCU8016284.1 hypothetical protein [Shewanella sp. SM72]MCU8051010.1 hypothetical protein [Shewanella sp. SM43]
MKQFAINARQAMTTTPALILRFNQLLIFHSLMLLAISMLTSTWLGQMKIIDMPLAWGFILVIPIAVSLSLLLSHQITRHSLSSLFGVWMLLWVMG